MFDEDIEKLLGENGEILDKPLPPIDNEAFEKLLPDEIGNNVEWSGVKQVGGIDGFGDSQFDQGATYKQVSEGRLNDRRANLQPWQDQLGNMLGQAVVGEIVGGTIEGLGYLLDLGSMADYVSGEETKWGNWLTDIGQGIRETGEENMRIYEEKPGEMNMSDPGYWFKNGVSVASSLSMLVPSMAATKALGFLGKAASKGAGALSKSLDVASKMGKQATWMTEGISQAVVSRHIENSMEAHGTFEDQRTKLLNEVNPKTGKNYTENEATQLASESAAYNYRHGWAMLLQDIPQYLALGRVFNPNTMKMENALSNAAKKGAVPKWQSALKGGAATFVSEGAEEGYQFYIAEKGKLLTDLKAGLITPEEYDRQISKALGSDEAMTSMLFGGLGGNLFQAAGAATNELFKSKTRKEIEAKAGDDYKAGLKQRATQIAVLQAQLAKADQSENDKYREGALNSMITETIIDAINHDKLDATIEALTQAPNMTEGEQMAFENEHGIEYNPELAKKYTPQVLENANKIKKMHYRNLNKASNKNVHKNIVGAMTLKEFQSQEALTFVNGLEKEYQELLDKSPFTARNPSTYLNNKSRMKVNQAALKKAIAYNQKQAKDTKDERLKKQYESLVKNHEKSLASFDKSLQDLENTKKDRTKEEVTADVKAAKAHKNLEDELISNRAESLLLEDFITKNEEDLDRLKSPKHQKEVIKNAIVAQIGNLQTKEEVEASKKNLDANPDYKQGSPEQKELADALDKRLSEIVTKEKEEAAKQAAEAYEKEKQAELEAKNKNPKHPDNNAISTVEDSLEDENAGEEIDFETAQEEEDAAHDIIKTNGNKTVSLLDAVQGTKAFQTWKEDGSDKIGTKVTYERSTKGRRTEDQNKAIKLFNENKDGTIPQFVYDNFPIIAYIGEGKSIFTYLPARPQYEGEQMVRYENGTAAERKAIIDTLAKGEPAVSEVIYTSGGKLITEVDDDGLPVENSILDLRQIKDADSTTLLYSDENGKLMDVTTKEQSRNFAGKQLKVAAGQPYRGGLFLELNKADGKKFPVRLNFKKNTEVQADAIAEILTEIAIPNKSGEKKNIEFNQPLSTVNEDLQTKIKEVMADELKVLGKDPTMNEIINMFVYVSEKTKNMSSRLYWKGEQLHFGDGKVLTPANRNNRGQLVDFLTNQKRRQFSLKFWNDPKIGPKYRKFVLEQGIINTNVIAGAPEFQTSAEKYTSKDGKSFQYRIQTYVKPINQEISDPVVKAPVQSGDKVIPAALQMRIDRSKKNGIQMNELGQPVAYFYIAKFGQLIGKEFPSMEAVMAEYDKEIAKLPAKKKAQVIPNVVDSDPISKKDYDAYVDTGKTSKAILDSIKSKVKEGADLSPRELSIFKGNVESIEKELKQEVDDAKVSFSPKKAVSSSPKRSKRKIKPAIKFKNNNTVKPKAEPTNNKDVNPFDQDEPGKINKKCKK